MTNREIDKAVAIEVMEWKWSKPNKDGTIYNHPNAIGFNPSTDISDAWLVVEKIVSNEGWEYEIMGDMDSVWVMFQAGDSNCPHVKPYDHSDGHGYSHGEAEDKSLPKAISLAALEAVKDE